MSEKNNMLTDKYDDGKKYTITFSMISDREYLLIINAIKRQVDYYRNKVFTNKDNENTDYFNYHIKYNYKVYCDLYKKIINDYDDVVKCL